MLHALLLAGSVVPVVAMLAALFAAAWIRQGEGERREAPAPARRR
jgi:hypothetical protein